jgi:hypothetical protein
MNYKRKGAVATSPAERVSNVSHRTEGRGWSGPNHWIVSIRMGTNKKPAGTVAQRRGVCTEQVVL